MKELISVEVKIYPRLKNLNRNIIEVKLEEGSNIETVMGKMSIFGGEEFKSRFYEDGKCKSNILLNGKAANLKTVVMDKDMITLVPYIGGG